MSRPPDRSPADAVRSRQTNCGWSPGSIVIRATGSEAEEYNKWYYNTNVWKTTTWMGIDCWKSVSDMWNYQEILFDLKPSLVIEFGTALGGSALFFASIMRQIGNPFKLLPWISTTRPPGCAAARSRHFVRRIAIHGPRYCCEHPTPPKTVYFTGKVFAILDSDHSMDHVLAEMKLLRPLLSAGDYLVVEDSMLNGHPTFLDGDRAHTRPSRRTRTNSPRTTRMTSSGRTNSA